MVILLKVLDVIQLILPSIFKDLRKRMSNKRNKRNVLYSIDPLIVLVEDLILTSVSELDVFTQKYLSFRTLVDQHVEDWAKCTDKVDVILLCLDMVNSFVGIVGKIRIQEGILNGRVTVVDTLVRQVLERLKTILIVTKSRLGGKH